MASVKISDAALTLTGAITGTLYSDSFEVYGGSPPGSGAAPEWHRSAAAVMSVIALGMIVNLFTEHPAGSGDHQGDGDVYTAAVSANGGPGAGTYAGAQAHLNLSDYTTSVTGTTTRYGSTVPTDRQTLSLDIGGTYSFSVDAELWCDYTDDYVPTSGDTGAPTNADQGIFDCPQKATVSFYYKRKVGGTARASVTSAGVTATHTITIASADVIDEGVQMVLKAATVGDGAPVGGSGSHEYRLTGVLNGAAVSGGAAVADADSGNRADNLTGLHCVITPYAGAVPDGSGGTTPYGFESVADLSAITYPDRQIALSGRLLSVADDFPDAAQVACSRYAGDTEATISVSGGSFGRTWVQAKHSCSLILGRNDSAGPLASHPYDSYSVVQETIESVDHRQAVSATVANAQDLGEYVAWQVTDDAGNVANRIVLDDIIYLHGYTMPGVTLSQDGAQTIDPCTSLTDWTGAALASGGGIKNSGTDPMVLSFPSGFDMSGYRYFVFKGASFNAGTHAVPLAIQGKTWTRYTHSTTVSQTNVIDLCDPDTGGADVDTLETKWPNTSTGRDNSTGPLWGISTIDSLTVGPFPAGVTFTFQGLNLVRNQGVSGDLLIDALDTHAVRFEDMVLESPAVTNDSGTTFTPHVRRGLKAKTDGRQSLEYRDFYVLYTEPGESGADPFYTPIGFGLADMAAYIDGHNGWHCSIDAPANDSSDGLRDGLLNRDLPYSAAMACYGGYFDRDGWHSTLDMDASPPGASVSLPCQLLFTTLADWPGGIGDVFGFGPAGGAAVPGAIYVGASKIYRAETDVLLIGTDHVDPAGRPVQLTAGPDAHGLQPDGTVVGAGSSGVRGLAVTTGVGLIGYTNASVPSPPNDGGAPNPDTIETSPGTGTVTDTVDQAP